MVKKVTFTLDDLTIQRLETASERLNRPKSQVIREAVADYFERAGRLSEAEKQRLLKVFDELVPRIPARTPRSVKREIDEIRTARRSGGRRHRSG
jgi:propanediol dehydratase small subunit